MRTVPRGPFKRFGYSPQLVSAGVEAGCELVHSHGLWGYHVLAAMQISVIRGAPYVVSPHGMLDSWALNQGRWRKRIAFLLYQRRHLLGARCVRALCEEEAGAIRACGYRGAIAVIPNGVAAPPPDAHPEPPWTETERCGRRVLLYLGRLHPKKNLLNLIEAWLSIKDRARGWMLALVGWGEPPYTRVLQDASKGHVTLAGPVFGRAKWDCLASADAFVMPSVSEGLPLNVLEAWASGLPVAMTSACNLPDGFTHGAAVEIDPEAGNMSAALESFLGLSKDTLTGVGASGRRLVAERYSCSAVAGRIADLYCWVIGRGDRPEFLS